MKMNFDDPIRNGAQPL